MSLFVDDVYELPKCSLSISPRSVHEQPHEQNKRAENSEKNDCQKVRITRSKVKTSVYVSVVVYDGKDLRRAYRRAKKHYDLSVSLCQQCLQLGMQTEMCVIGSM